MFNPLWPHGLQHVRLPCSSLSSRVCSKLCPLSWWCHPTTSSTVVPYSSCLQSFPASRFFSNELTVCIRWPKYWSFSFSIRPSSEHSGLISFRIDWFELLAVQRTLKSLLQHYSLNVSIPQRLSLLYGPTFTPVHDSWKTHSFDCMDLCRQSDVSAFNMLSRFLIAFLPRSKCLLISWLQSLQWF